MVYYILVGIFSSNLLYHKKDCFPTLLRVVAVFFIARFFTVPFLVQKSGIAIFSLPFFFAEKLTMWGKRAII